MVRAPGRRGTWSPEEVAHVLQIRRAQLLGMLSRRRDGAAVSAELREEIIDEAISLVVMSRKPIRDEEHLEGSFWETVRLLLIEHRSGRHTVRVGSRSRVDFQSATAALPAGGDVGEMVAARERLARAADYMAQLDPFEQRVVTLMAVRGTGVKLAARRLGVPTKTVVAAVRSADQKLDQVAVIAAAGRLCAYRRAVIVAHAQGTAHAREEQAARAHLEACVGCRREYVQMVREMRGRDFQRRASAAFVPLPELAGSAHGSLLERIAAFLGNSRLPSTAGSGERAAGLLGGGGLAAKVAVAGTAAVVVAGAGVVDLTSGTHHRHEHPPAHPRVMSLGVPQRPPVRAVEPRLTVAAPARKVALGGPVRPVSSAPGRFTRGGFSYLGGATPDASHRESAPAAERSTTTAAASSLSYLGGGSSATPTATTSRVAAGGQRSEARAGGGQFGP